MSVNPDLHRRAMARLVVSLGGLVALTGASRAIARTGFMPEEVMPKDNEGTVEQLATLSSPGIAARDVEIWCPPDFEQGRRYAVLYMHDGQMLFDPRHTWNRKAWEIDRIASQLIRHRLVRDFLVVGIANDSARRHAEFFPQAALDYLQPDSLRKNFIDKALGGRPAADDYLKFIVEIVKPLVDERYPTLTDRDATFIMGSSMGGLISLYAACEYPNIFGGAAALSTHWIGTYQRNPEIPRALRQYLERKLPPADRTRLYMDRGARGLDALYDDAQAQVDVLMKSRGYEAPNFMSRVYPDGDHDETSWAARLDDPLRFLLPPSR